MTDSPLLGNWPSALVLVCMPAIFVWYAIMGLPGGNWAHLIVGLALLVPFILAVATWVYLKEGYMQELRNSALLKLRTDAQKTELELTTIRLRNEILELKCQKMHNSPNKAKSPSGGYEVGVHHDK
jgi:hypothetical protein